MRRLIWLLAALAVAAVPAISSGEPSDGCANGEVPPSTTPLGVGARQTGDPGDEPINVLVCNDGSVVPPPAKGHVRVRVVTDRDDPSVMVVADGDSDNATLACTDGYAGAKLDREGTYFYESADGDFFFFARPKPAGQWLGNLIGSCTAPSES